MSLEAVVAAMTRRIDPQPPSLRHLLWDSTAIVMGLRHPADLIVHLLRGVRDMKESSYYQYILAEGHAEGRTKGLAEGRAEGQAKGLAEGQAKGLAEGESQGAIKEARRLLIRQAERRLGPGSPEYRASIEQITRLERLERLHDRVAEVATWGDLLADDEDDDPAA